MVAVVPTPADRLVRFRFAAVASPADVTLNNSPAPIASAVVGDVVPIPSLPVAVMTTDCVPLSFT